MGEKRLTRCFGRGNIGTEAEIMNIYRKQGEYWLHFLGNHYCLVSDDIEKVESHLRKLKKRLKGLPLEIESLKLLEESNEQQG